ncbi:hypothetical protein [Dipodfec virus UOA04_Rod_1143]|nr:hypothetical protein [Dipodfec virus UOA04_Rod_1143]
MTNIIMILGAVAAAASALYKFFMDGGM